MIQKKMNKRGIQSRTMHDAFLWMLNASIDTPEKWDAGEIIGKYYFYAFKKHLTEGEFDDTLIDRIRIQLLMKAGSKNLILKESGLMKKIRSNLIFTER